MTERDELIAWATKNKKDPTGRWRTPDEIAYFAMINDFDPELVYHVFVDWQVNFGLDTRMREAMGYGKEMHYLERQDPLYEAWRELGVHLTTGKQWGDK